MICGVCDRNIHPHTRSRLFASRTFVPSTNLTWDNVQCTRRRSVKGKELETIETVQDLARELSHDRTSCIDLKHRNLKCGPASDNNAELIVILVSTFGTVVRAGSLVAPACGALLLQGHGATFEDVAFTGGAVICAGSDFSGTFRRCTFRCDVSVVHGARARFSACTFLSHNFGLVASGRDTYATLDGCTVRQAQAGVLAEAGAAVAADTTHVIDAMSAVIVNDAGSHTALTNCTMRGGGHDSHYAVLTHGGGVTIRGCRVSAYQVPLSACGHAGAAGFLDVRRIHAEKFGYGVFAQGRTRLAVAESEFDLHGPADRKGLHMGSVVALQTDSIRGQSSVQLERCGIDGESAKRCEALTVTKGSRLAARLCKIGCMGDVVYADCDKTRVTLEHCEGRSRHACCRLESAGCTLTLRACTLTSSEKACAIDLGSRLVARDSVFQGPPAGAGPEMSAVAVEVSDGSHADLLRCMLRRAPTAVHTIRSRVTVKHCHVRDLLMALAPPARGAQVVASGTGYQLAGGVMKVVGGSVEGCIIGAAAGGGRGVLAELTVEDVTFDGTAHGVQTNPDTVLNVARCRFNGARTPSQFRALHAQACAVGYGAGVSGAVTDCEFRTYHRGVMLLPAGRAPCSVAVRGSTFADMLPSAVCIETHADLLVEGCSFARCPQGMLVSGADVTVRKCAFGPRVSSGVTVQECDLTAVDCRFQGCEVGLGGAAGANISAQDCTFVLSSATAQGICAESDRFSVNAKRLKAEGGNAAVAAMCAADGTGLVKLVECEVTGATVGVDLRGPGIQGSLLRCDVSGASRGVLVTQAATTRIRKSTVSGCGVGVFVGSHPALLEEPCALCGKAGSAATAAAFDHAAAPPPPGSRCEHRGVRSVANLACVKIADCTQAGVEAERFGRVEASDVDVLNCGIGVAEHVTGVRSTFGDCSVRAADGQRSTAVHRYSRSGVELGVAEETISGIDVV